MACGTESGILAHIILASDLDSPRRCARDVTSGYICFPRAGGLYSPQTFLNKRATLHPPTDTLIRLAELVLNKNTFSFRDEMFSQISGVAVLTKMGTAMPVSSGNTLNTLFCSNIKQPVPAIYKIDIEDDIGAT